MEKLTMITLQSLQPDLPHSTLLDSGVGRQRRTRACVPLSPAGTWIWMSWCCQALLAETRATWAFPHLHVLSHCAPLVPLLPCFIFSCHKDRQNTIVKKAALGWFLVVKCTNSNFSFNTEVTEDHIIIRPPTCSNISNVI